MQKRVSPRRLLTTIPYLTWGALSVTQALEGWNTILTGGLVVFLVVIIALFKYGKADDLPDNTLWEEFKLTVIAVLSIAIPVAFIMLLEEFPAPYLAAILSAGIACGFVQLMFSRMWLARVVTALTAVSMAGLGIIVTGVFLWVSLEMDGDPLAGLRRLPSQPAQYAAIALAAGSPIGFVAGILVVREELP